MGSFREALRTLNFLKVEGVFEDYARPSRDLLRRLRAGKGSLRRHRTALSLREKVRQVLELQRLKYPLLAKQRPLRSWEHPWDVEP